MLIQRKCLFEGGQLFKKIDLEVSKKMKVFLIEVCYFDEKEKHENEN